MFLHTACIATMNYKLMALSVMEHLQMFLVLLKVEVRFPAGTIMNDQKKEKKKQNRCNLTFKKKEDLSCDKISHRTMI